MYSLAVPEEKVIYRGGKSSKHLKLSYSSDIDQVMGILFLKFQLNTKSYRNYVNYLNYQTDLKSNVNIVDALFKYQTIELTFT